MEFSDREWIDLLSGDHPPSKEHVVYVTKFRKMLRVRKDVWEHLFAGWGGLDMCPGNEVQLVNRDEGGPKFTVPDWAADQLALTPRDVACVTRRGDQFYLKKLELVERPTRIPGTVVIDTFGDSTVTRTYTNRPELDAIRPDDLHRWLIKMGRLRYDPLVPFQGMGGRLGLLSRETFLGGHMDDDLETIEGYRQAIAGDQQASGSWEESVLCTASNLIRLLEMGATVEEPAVERAAQWLLRLPEPAGLPGLFLVSESLAQRFNEWKAKPGAKGRPHRRESKGELQQFYAACDYATNCALDACELRLTWTSALVLEALLRCGLHRDPRVVRAINTLFALSGQGGWCGCGYLDAKVNVADVAEAVDFSRFPVPGENLSHSIDWFPEEKDILEPTYDGRYHALAIGKQEALLVKSWHSTGLCTMVMHRALSYHPQYAGSALEAIDALRLAYVQSAYGTWGSTVYVSSMLGFLSRLTHPLAAFLVLRTVPWLIREQRPDGLWEEAPIDPEYTNCPPPTKQESSFLILRALKQFGFLDALRPA